MLNTPKNERNRYQPLLNRSRCNPESFSSSFIPGLPRPSGLKRCQSAMTIRNQRMNQSIHSGSLQKKYQKLKQNYKALAAEITGQNEEYANSKAELKKLEERHERNRAEIKRLRGMLGFLQKKHQGAQTNESMMLEKEENHLKNVQSQNIIKANQNPYQTESLSNFHEKSFNHDSKLLTSSSSSNIWISKTPKNMRCLGSRESTKLEKSPSCQHYKQKYKFKRSVKMFDL